MNFNKTYSYNELMEEVEKLAQNYPKKVNVISIGRTNQNRSIPMLIFGSGKKKVLFSGGVHGRESINPLVLIAMAQAYVGNDPDILRAEGRIYLIPLLNPDGYEKAITGEILWKNNARGIDINRNFPSQTFREKWKGDTAASEEETKALIRAFYEIKPDGYMDYHSRGRSIFYYRNQMDASYNEKQLLVAKALCDSTGYILEKPEDEVEENDTGGNTVHFFSEYFKKPAITIETVPEEEGFPLAGEWQEKTYREIKNTFGCFLENI